MHGPLWTKKKLVKDKDDLLYCTLSEMTVSAEKYSIAGKAKIFFLLGIVG